MDDVKIACRRKWPQILFKMGFLLRMKKLKSGFI